MKKIYFVTKYISAESILEVLQKERNHPPDQIEISNAWAEGTQPNIHKMVGMKVLDSNEEDELPK